MTGATKQKAHISFVLNGESAEVAFAPHKTLLELLREDLGLTGTKHGCELGECGACTVLTRDLGDAQPMGAPAAYGYRPVLSCLVLALECEGTDVRTIEAMADGPTLAPLQA